MCCHPISMIAVHVYLPQWALQNHQIACFYVIYVIWTSITVLMFVYMFNLIVVRDETMPILLANTGPYYYIHTPYNILILVVFCICFNATYFLQPQQCEADLGVLVFWWRPCFIPVVGVVWWLWITPFSVVQCGILWCGDIWDWASSELTVNDTHHVLTEQQLPVLTDNLWGYCLMVMLLWTFPGHLH